MNSVLYPPAKPKLLSVGKTSNDPQEKKNFKKLSEEEVKAA